MYSADDIVVALRRSMPAELHGAVPALAHLLAEVLDRPLTKQEVRERVIAEGLEPLLAELAGKRVVTSTVALSFENASNIGDVNVGTAVGGNFVHLVVNVQASAPSAASPEPGAVPPPPAGARQVEANGARAQSAPTASVMPAQPAPPADLPTAEFAPSRSQKLQQVAGGVVAALFGVGGLVYAATVALGLAGNGDALTPALVGLALLSFGAFYAREGYRDDRRIVVFGDRVERHRSGKVSSVLWRDVRRAWKQVTVHRSSRKSTPTISGFKLDVGAGRVVELGLDWDGAQHAHLDELIRHAVSENLLPRYRDLYNAGRNVEFAPNLILSRQGVRWGNQQIRWERVERAGFEGFDVTLYTRDSSPPNTPLKLRLGEATANYFLFTALVNEIVIERRLTSSAPAINVRPRGPPARLHPLWRRRG